MPFRSDSRRHEPASFSSLPPRRVLGALIAYVSAVFAGLAAVVALATAEVSVQAWIAPL